MARNAGIITKAKGIKNLKLASKVKEIDIQYKFVAKYPNPKNHPYKKEILSLFKKFIFLNKKIKNKLNVIKFINRWL